VTADQSALPAPIDASRGSSHAAVDTHLSASASSAAAGFANAFAAFAALVTAAAIALSAAAASAAPAASRRGPRSPVAPGVPGGPFALATSGSSGGPGAGAVRLADLVIDFGALAPAGVSRLSLAPARWRPAAFISLLEEPG
jgi:hypothetical protein